MQGRVDGSPPKDCHSSLFWAAYGWLALLRRSQRLRLVRQVKGNMERKSCSCRDAAALRMLLCSICAEPQSTGTFLCFSLSLISGGCAPSCSLQADSGGAENVPFPGNRVLPTDGFQHCKTPWSPQIGRQATNGCCWLQMVGFFWSCFLFGMCEFGSLDYLRIAQTFVFSISLLWSHCWTVCWEPA